MEAAAILDNLLVVIDFKLLVFKTSANGGSRRRFLYNKLTFIAYFYWAELKILYILVQWWAQHSDKRLTQGK